MFENEKFQYRLMSNESEEMCGEWGTENFQFPLAETGTIEAYKMDGCIEKLKQKFKKFSNDDWYWDGPEDGSFADFWFGNDKDGLSLRFEITLMI